MVRIKFAIAFYQDAGLGLSAPTLRSLSSILSNPRVVATFQVIVTKPSPPRLGPPRVRPYAEAKELRGIDRLQVREEVLALGGSQSNVLFLDLPARHWGRIDLSFLLE